MRLHHLHRLNNDGLQRRSSSSLSTRRHFDDLANELGIQAQTQWYFANSSEKLNGLEYRTALKRVYPEYTWYPWPFGVPAKFWSKVSNQKMYYDWLANELDLETQEEWYSVPFEKLFEQQGKGIQKFYTSASRVLETVYPEYQWFTRLFQQVPQSFWQNIESRRSYLDWLAGEPDIETQQDWYGVSHGDIKDNSGAGFLASRYNGSHILALTDVLSEFTWYPWLFSRAPNSNWTELSLSRQFLDWFAETQGIEAQEDWYTVRADDIRSAGGSGLLEHYYDSLLKLLESVLSQFEWTPWLLDTFSSSFWDEPSNQKRYFDWFVETSGVKTDEDWKEITSHDIHHTGGAGILFRHGKSLPRALRSIYSEKKTFQDMDISKSYWSFVSNQRKAMDEIAKDLGIETQEDWYPVKVEQVSLLTDAGFLRKEYRDSMYGALKTIYPEFIWSLWKFERSVQSISVMDHRKYFDMIASKLGLQKQSDFYDITAVLLRRVTGEEVPKKFLPLSLSLASAYSEFTWFPWLFEVSHPGLWCHSANHRKFFDWVAEEYNIEDHSHWYSYGHSDVARKGGDALLRKHGSLPAALEAVYPEYKWQGWLFQKVPAGFWKDTYNVKNYIAWLTEVLAIEKMEDWYNVTYQQLLQLAGGTLLNQCNLPALLKRCFPRYPWNRRLFATGNKSQDLLRRKLQQILPYRKDIMTNYKHPQLIFQDTQKTMELDIFIPLISLAFEYHGEYHYCFQNIQGEPANMQVKDQEKILACSKIGITLISIPYWWDRTLSRQPLFSFAVSFCLSFNATVGILTTMNCSLVATIHQHRPDLIPDPGKGTPIPPVPPKYEKKKRQRRKLQKQTYST